jgi:cell division protein FtsL
MFVETQTSVNQILAEDILHFCLLLLMLFIFFVCCRLYSYYYHIEIGRQLMINHNLIFVGFFLLLMLVNWFSCMRREL